jgi:hypothetical protein
MVPEGVRKKVWRKGYSRVSSQLISFIWMGVGYHEYKMVPFFREERSNLMVKGNSNYMLAGRCHAFELSVAAPLPDKVIPRPKKRL